VLPAAERLVVLPLVRRLPPAAARRLVDHVLDRLIEDLKDEMMAGDVSVTERLAVEARTTDDPARASAILRAVLRLGNPARPKEKGAP
jgi:hypothetical protein